MDQDSVQQATVQQRPVRAGVFAQLTAADNAVDRLLAGGFRKEEITVICSDEAKERHFREFEHQQPAGTNTPAAAALGSSVGAVIGGITTTAVGLAAGGLPLLVIGAAGVSTGGVLGGFLGAMMTRGGEKEAANYYDQAVLDGKILIAVEVHGPDADERLSTAEQILQASGAEPLPLPEG
ncbi:MAG: hypothetical protein WD872_04915 [Pirellulaceae bacterium]